MKALSSICLACCLVGCVPDESSMQEQSDDVTIQPAAASCDVQIGVTSQSGNTITGYGSQSNCGTQGQSTLTIQRSRWFGWEDLASATVIGSGHDVFVHYNCAGTGTHEFRTTHTGTTIGGSFVFKESNHITATCN